ncbi:DUF2332 domain-containing protein [Bradyrhizobium sp. LHD-71]|uniref:DUF2332 domain-containing protein n=1 Tax=Bradyrhizobium sp. LHD-71 TaxID=3072141 RepID=UPI00280F38C1|nr:DUF2332 domain-containing protein [Bradyrhizobium sp. LHD-71]MDQ8727224.1 DUF2332 domain-containing protein [Bradyrhizobium sp. LHD-71]
MDRTSERARTAARYQRFAETEARGRSPLYEQLARGVAASEDVLAFLLTLPDDRRQPNLLLAAVRHLFGVLDWVRFRDAVLVNSDAVRSVMLTRSTQTNEPARCATLLPLLMRLPQPLALIEVGASAGLCLLPDRYDYDFGQGVFGPGESNAPLFRCRVNEATPVPSNLPKIAWRAGLDLNPLDVSVSAEAGWLETLVWPEQTDRLANLRAAIKVAARSKPCVQKGDLRNDLRLLAREAPKDATLVIFHTAVLAYVSSPDDRQAFAAEAMSFGGCWIANEAPGVFPEIARSASITGPEGAFLLSMNAKPVAWADPHGASLQWIVGAQA